MMLPMIEEMNVEIGQLKGFKGVDQSIILEKAEIGNNTYKDYSAANKRQALQQEIKDEYTQHN